MKNENIVKLDRTTVQEFLPMLTHPGIFSKFDNLPKKDEILEKEKSRLGVDQLTLVQERTALSKIGKYRSKAYVIRDYGDYVIAFSAKMYLENLIKTEEELKDEIMLKKYGEKRISEALERINTYKLAHKLAIIILGEVYIQSKHEKLVIPKQRLIELLGYKTTDESIYNHIKEAINSLRWLDYIVYKYNTRKKLKRDYTTTGNFIYNFSDKPTEFEFWVNPLFVGCAIHMAQDGSKLSEEEHKRLFARGYLEYPLSHIAELKGKSNIVYFLSHYLLTQDGNIKLNTSENKIVAISVQNLYKVAKITNQRPGVRVNTLLNALEEIAHIQHIEPPIAELRKKKSKRVEEMTLHIYLPQQKKKKYS